MLYEKKIFKIARRIRIVLPLLFLFGGIIIGSKLDCSSFFAGNEPPKKYTVVEIFTHNLKAILCNISGIITLGISTAFNIFLTGLVLGIHIAKAVSINIPLKTILWHTLPHFTEYIAIWVSGMLGFQGTTFLFSYKSICRKTVKKILLILITLVPLLFFGAYMEVEVAAKY